MSSKQFLEQFSQIVNSSNGIEKLRELILYFAVSGKLTHQRNNENTDILFNEIKSNQKVLLQEKKIKKNKKVTPINKTLYKIPNNWKWVKFGDICHFESGKTPSRKESLYWNDSKYPWFSISDLEHGKVIYKSNELITEEAKKKVFKSKIVPKGTLLMSFKLTIGKMSILGEDAFHNEAIISIYPFVDELKEYLLRCLNGFDLTADNKDALKGKTLNQESLSNIMIALPPKEEISRIVYKVVNLMKLCDQLENQQKKKEEIREKTVQSIFNSLVKDQTPQEFQNMWDVFCKNDLVLLKDSNDIYNLRVTILNLAFKGYLVDQKEKVPSTILDILKNEKIKLINDKKIKKSKPFIDFKGSTELLVEIPKSWKFCRLDDVSYIVRGGSPRPAGDLRYYEGKIPFLKVADITRKSGMFVENYTSTIKEEGLKKTRLITTRTLLLTNSGATLGVPAICDFDATFNDGIAAFLYLSDRVDDEYLYYYLKSKTNWFLDVASRGQGQPNLNTDIIRACWLPLPPLEEQKRIVKKIVDLLQLCDKLEQQLKDKEETLQKFTLAIIKPITGIESKEKEKMKVPKNELISILKIKNNPTKKDEAPLAKILLEHKGELSSKLLWTHSKLDIETFYKQLKIELYNNWIEEPKVAKMITIEEE